MGEKLRNSKNHFEDRSEGISCFIGSKAYVREGKEGELQGLGPEQLEE